MFFLLPFLQIDNKKITVINTKESGLLGKIECKLNFRKKQENKIAKEKNIKSR